ncbi:hypothetical protein CXG81DRAFT_16542 [Caulochytrium protostelioides]|uniref:Uncharacterized protein n=1 Tax=Caulochytrium protostelioides TaxID=1555241 RepID=A0A4P9XEN1_9FUNG|nr:hypothetical protein CAUPRSCDRAFT_10793 [Caulochytrium protostelioides]RKP03972.1 hypothetical protein CXG81DRAFT_16542 [Caulochytrium protostelioides]|eukprot:RKP03972.1 hypothetical protein CXG81DRAFT_16542 [Caulochytrium protostelioides]
MDPAERVPGPIGTAVEASSHESMLSMSPSDEEGHADGSHANDDQAARDADGHGVWLFLASTASFPGKTDRVDVWPSGTRPVRTASGGTQAAAADAAPVGDCCTGDNDASCLPKTTNGTIWSNASLAGCCLPLCRDMALRIGCTLCAAPAVLSSDAIDPADRAPGEGHGGASASAFDGDPRVDPTGGNGDADAAACGGCGFARPTVAITRDGSIPRDKAGNHETSPVDGCAIAGRPPMDHSPSWREGPHDAWWIPDRRRWREKRGRESPSCGALRQEPLKGWQAPHLTRLW